MFKVAIDKENKTAQFKLTNALSGFSVKVYGDGYEYGDSEISDLQRLEFGKGRLNIDLIRKNQPNVSLVDMSLSEYQSVVGILFKREGFVLEFPLSVGGDLVLDDENYLLVTLSNWGWDDVHRIEVFENRVLGNTDRPIVIKAVEVDEKVEVNTEFYNSLVFGSSIDSLETIRTEQDDFGDVVSEKQELSYGFMSLQYGFVGGVMFPVVENQKVKLEGKGKAFLVQL